jgi:hypothetical protein
LTARPKRDASIRLFALPKWPRARNSKMWKKVQLGAMGKRTHLEPILEPYLAELLTRSELSQEAR